MNLVFKKVDYLLSQNNKPQMENPRYKTICPWIKNNASAIRLLAQVNNIKQTKYF